MLEAAAAAQTLQETIDGLHGRTIDIGVDAAGFQALKRDVADASADLMIQTGLLGEIRDRLLQDAGAATVYNVAIREAAGATSDAGAGATAAAAGFRLFGTGIRLTGTLLHWIVAGTAEFLAVAIPAAIALGAGFLVAAQGAQNAYNHIQALYTTLEAVGPATHQTMGDVLGLGHALQTAQNAANPGVYTILGSVINDLKTRFADFAGMGLQVVHMFDEFAARVTVDLQGALGGQLQGLLAGAVTYLQEFGQILGNVGHAILNFASAMPGLAAVLLAIATAVSRVVLVISSIPAPILTAVIALEEFYRWGGVVLGLIIRLAGAPMAFAAWLTGANFITKFGAALSTIVGTIGAVLVRIGGLVAGLGAADGAVEGFGAAIAAAGGGMLEFAAMSPLAMAGVAGLVAGVVGLIVVLEHVKDATDSWVAATDKAVQSASDLNVLGTIGKTLAENTIRLSSANEQLSQSASHVSQTYGVMSRYVQGGSGAMARQAQDVQDLTQQQQHLVSVAATVITNANNLGAAFHTSAAGALALANAAGVNLQVPMAKTSEAFKIAEQQIRNLITGLGAMGAPAGMVGQDMTAIGIQSQLAATKVQQLNQAQDAWISSITGGMSAFAQFQTTLMGISHAASAMQFNGAGAMRTWGQLAQVTQQANAVIDTLRTGMAEGAVSTKLFTNTVKGMVGEMVPFVAGNKVAVAWLQNIAHEAGGPASGSLKDLANWAGVSGAAAKDQLAKGMESASIAMSNMSKVAQNLSAVINSQLDAAMASAIAKTLNITGLTQTYTNDLAKYGAQAPQTASAQNNLNNALQRAYALGQSASAALNHTGSSAAAAASSMAHARDEAAGLAAAIGALQSKTITITTVMQTLHIGGGSAPTRPGYQAGTMRAAAGAALVGERGPEMVLFGGGEAVLNNADTRRFMNTPAGSYGHPMPAFGGGSGGMTEVHSHINVNLDGQQIFSAIKTETARYNVRNGNPQSGRLSPGA